MNKKITINFLLSTTLVLLSLMSTNLFSQTVGTGIFFQAVARDNFANPAKDRKIYVQSSIVQTTATGTKVLIEDFKTTTDATGVFSISVGQGTRVGGTMSSLTTIDWSNGPYYLNLKVAITPIAPIIGWDYTKDWIELGTTSFGAVPYALYAGTASGLDGKLSIKDTTSMLALYAKVQVVKTLETAVGSKIANTDTAAMLAPYKKMVSELIASNITSLTADAINSALNSKVNVLDSNIMYVTPTQLAAKTFDIAPISTSIATKLNIADSIVKYITPSQLASKTFDSTAIYNQLGLKENSVNKSTANDLGGSTPSDIAFPSQKAVKNYVDAQIGTTGVANGSITTVKLADGAVTDVKIAAGISASKVGLENVNNTSDALKPISAATEAALNDKEALVNKSTSITLDAGSSSDIKYPSQLAVKTYVDNKFTNQTVGFSNMQTIGANTVLGNTTGTTGAITEIATTGTGNIVRSISPTLTTPVINGTITGSTIIPVANGGTGANSLTGFIKGNGTSAFTTVASIPVADVAGAVKTVNGSTPAANGNVAIAFGSVTTGTLAARPTLAGTNGDIYVVSGDATTAENGRTFISNGSTWNEVTANQASTDARYVKLSGSTMAGDLAFPTSTKITITDAPSSSTDVANKLYVDNKVANATPDALTSATGKIQLAGDLSGTANAPTIAPGAVSLSKMAGLSAQNKLLGTGATGGLGVAELSLGTGLSFSGSTLNGNVGTVTSLTGTTNRLTVTNSSTTPTVDIASTYVGQSSITTLGTITSGIWNGTTIALANGGTGATNASAALTNLGGEASANKSTATDMGNASPSDVLFPSQKAVKSYIDVKAAAAGVADGSLTDIKIADVAAGKITGTIGVTQGGTGATTAAGARTNLGLVIGTDVQAPLVAGTNYLTPTGSAANLISFPTLNQSTTGNAATATKLAASKNINGVAFDGSADIIVTADASTLTGTSLKSTVVGSSLTSVGTITAGVWSGTTIALANGGTGATNAADARTNLGLVIGTDVQAPLVAGTNYLTPTGSAANLTSFPTLNQSTTGNAATSTKLAASKNINEVAFDGSADITVTADATTLTGTSLKSTVVGSSLTSVGTITSGVWNGTTIALANGGTGATNAAGARTNLELGTAATSSIADFSAPLTFTAPLSRAINAISIPAASSSVDGYLSSTDWSTFNNKINASQKAAVNGIASLGADGKIPSSQIPAISFSTVDVVVNEAAMLALTGKVAGAIAVNTGASKNFVLNNASSPGSLASWTELATPASVSTVNGKSGLSVSLVTDDIAEGSTNKYFSNTLARNAISATSPLAYNAGTGVVSLGTLPTGNGGTGLTAIGTSGQILTSNGSNLVWSNPSTSIGAATNATNLSGGAVGSLPYQTATNVTGFLAVGTNGQVLTLTSGVPSWEPAAVTGVTAINGITSGTQTLTVGTAGTAPAFNSSSSTHTLNIPLASATSVTAGLLSKADYDVFNAKQSTLTAGSGISIASGTISATGLTTNNLTSTAGITNTQLANSTTTLGSTTLTLGGTITSVTGLSSLSSTNLTGTLSGTATTANALTTGRTISTTGDITYTSGAFDGATNVTGAATLTNTTVTAGSYGSSTAIPTFTVDAKGRLTAASTVGITAGVSSLNYTSTTSYAAGGTISGTSLTLTAADGTNPGLVSTSAQTIAGAKTFSSNVTAPNFTGALTGNATTATTAGNITATTNTTLTSLANLATVGTITSGVWSGTAIANNKLANSATTIGTTAISLGGSATTIAGLTSVTSTGFTGALTGNASTATTLLTSRNINGIAFNGSADITVAADAGTMTGTTLASNIVNSSLTTIGTLTAGGVPYSLLTGTVPTWNQSTTGNATTATTAGNITATTNTTLTSLANLATVGTITSGVWSGTAIANNKLANSATTIGTTAISLGGSATTIAGLTSVTSTGFTGALTGNASTATKLAATKNINGVAFDGSTDITVAADAGTLSGTTLKSTVVNSSLTTIGTLTAGGVPYSLLTGTVPTWNQSTTGNATTATTAGNITATTNTTLTSLANLATVGTITSGTWSASTIDVAHGGTGTTSSTGSGSLVLATSPTLVTPVLGTPTSVTLTNATGLPIASGVSGLGTGIASFLATPTSSNLLAATTDETGTGALVFANTPTLVTPVIGAATGTSLSLSSTLAAGAATFSSTVNVTGATTLGSTLNVTGAGTFSSTLAVGGTLGVTGATTLSSTLNVTGAGTFSSTLGVTGTTTLTGGVTIPIASKGLGKVLTSDANGVATWQTGLTTITTKTDSYTITNTDNFIIYTTAGVTGKTFTLPTAAASGAGKEFTIKNMSGFSLIVTSTSSLMQEYILGGTYPTSINLGTDASNNWVKVISDGTNWIVFRALF